MIYKPTTLLLLAISAIGTGSVAAQTLGAIPVPVAANPAFIQTSQAPSASANAAPASVGVQTPVKASVSAEGPAAVKQPAAQEEKPKAVATAQPSAEKPAESGPIKAEVNPMTGKAADIETLTHDYEKEKLLAAIATEKQKRLTAERSGVDQAMPAPPLGANKPPLAPQASANSNAAAFNGAAEAPIKPAKVVKMKPVPVMPATPTLAGTMMQNGERYAIIEQGGESVVVKQGQTAFGQLVDKVSSTSVTLGGMVLAGQPSSVMRVARSDVQTSNPGASGQLNALGSGPMPAPLTGPGINPSLPMTIPTQGQSPINTSSFPGQPGVTR